MIVSLWRRGFASDTIARMLGVSQRRVVKVLDELEAVL
jgi:DNA-binding MarR family transcriptional regulator